MSNVIHLAVIKAATGRHAVAEYKFHPVRRWRFDYAIPDLMVAVEIEGGAFSGGRHTRGRGYINDMEKYNSAQLMGWRVLRYAPDQIGPMAEDLRSLSGPGGTA